MKRILFVDDDDDLAAVATAGLLARGFDVVRMSNGVEALAEYERQRPDVVVTDLMMPEKEGWTLIGDLRRRDRTVKIIATTGGGLDTPRTYLKVARQAGADAMIEKPYTIDQLVDAISRSEQPPDPEPPIIPGQRPRPPRKGTTESDGTA